MVFQLKKRNITKEDEQLIYVKYSRLLRKNNIDINKVICELYLSIIYLYFCNPKRKLYKLFFPVIMANFMELGSINSVIKEYKIKKKLYSESYTCRIIKQLNENDSLEISRIFRKILYKILRKNGFKNKGCCIAIDITVKPFYGNKRFLMVKGAKNKAGTNFGIHYLTASIVEEGVRFNLLCIPINALTSIQNKVKEMIKEIEKIVKIKVIYLDRAFGNKNYCRILKLSKYKFITPITKNDKLKCIEYQIKEETKKEKYICSVSKIDYIFYEDKQIEYQEKIKLLALCEDDEVFFFITNINNFNWQDYYLLIKSYRFRFGIETNYRVDNIFSALTTSVISSVRYLLMQISLITQDLWTLINFLTFDKNRKQPREKFKKNYSVLAVIKARTKQLNFIWRPIITAVEFKRRLVKIF